MDSTIRFLKEWSINFLKNKDLIFKNILEIDNLGEEPKFRVEYKTKEQLCYIVDKLGNHLFEEFNPDNYIGVFTFHSHENFDFLIKNWNNISKIPKLTIYFINPFIETENKWVIHPNTHSKIADRESFLRGMSSMFESVMPITEKDLKTVQV